MSWVKGRLLIAIQAFVFKTFKCNYWNGQWWSCLIFLFWRANAGVLWMDYQKHGERSEPSETSLMTQKRNDEAQTRATVMRMEGSRNCQEIFCYHIIVNHVWSAYSLPSCIIISRRWKWLVSWPHYASNVSGHFYVFPHCQDLLDSNKSTNCINFSGFRSQAVLVSLCGQSHWQSQMGSLFQL